MAQRQLRRATLGQAFAAIVIVTLAVGACSNDSEDAGSQQTAKGGASTTSSTAGRAGAAVGGSSGGTASGGTSSGASGAPTGTAAGTTGIGGSLAGSGGVLGSGGITFNGGAGASAAGSPVGNGGALPTGGTTTLATGGAITAGASGTATGGAATGGTATGGAATGGAATGGAPPCAGINLQTDLNNCGTCGHACPALANMNVACVTGGCAYTCKTGFDDCNKSLSDGCEVNLLNDPKNCGGCSKTEGTGGAAGAGNTPAVAGNGTAGATGAQASAGTAGTTGVTLSPFVCPNQNGTAVCSNGTCQVPTCSQGWGNCDSKLETGCETQLITTSNCGACGTTCTRANAAASCALTPGTCTIDTCNTGWGNCNPTAATGDSDGCETSLRTAANCGGCGKACPSAANASPTCPSGTCALQCNANFYDLDGSYATGCECSSGDAASQSCADAAAAGGSLTTVLLDGSATIAGNLVPGSNSDWYAVTFNGGGCNNTPRVTLTRTVASDPIVFRMTSNCTTMTGDTCREGGAVSDPGGFTDWEFTWDGVTPAPCNDAPVQSNSHATITYYVQVFALATLTSCGGYALSFSN